MVLGVTIGVGITVFLLMFFTSIIDKEKHKHIRTFFLLISLPLLFLIPSSLVLEKEICEVVPINETLYYEYGNNFTDYHWEDYEGASEPPTFTPADDAVFIFHIDKTTTYDTYCYTKEDGSRTFIKAFSVILVVFMIYIAFIFFSDIILFLKDLIKKV